MHFHGFCSNHQKMIGDTGKQKTSRQPGVQNENRLEKSTKSIAVFSNAFCHTCKNMWNQVYCH